MWNRRHTVHQVEIQTPIITRNYISIFRFQRHLIVFVFIITVICLTIILPINFTMGNIQGQIIEQSALY